MQDSKVVMIATDYPLNYDVHFRKRLDNLMARAVRHSSRFKGIDLPAMQAAVNRNISRLQLSMNGKYMGLLDLMNYVRNDRKLPDISVHNAAKYFTHSEMITLNGIYLYQVLKENNYDPLIIQNYSLADLPDALKGRPLAACISSNFIYLDEIADMAGQIKAIDPQLPVIAGGMLIKKVLNRGFNLFPETLKWLSTFHGKVDVFVIEFQGEQSLVKVLDALKAGKGLRNVPNVAFFDEDGKLVFTPREQESLDIDQTTIAWDRIPGEYLRKTLPVTTSRGCSYRCRFCTCWRLCPQVHYKSLPVLREELRRIQGLGFVRHVRFTDDNFTGNKKRLRSVLQMMIQEAFDFTWSTYARAGSLTAELVPMMRAAGCEFVNMGIESGSQKILNNMDKRLKRDSVLRGIERLNEQGIYGEGGFILGYPGENRETFSETVDLINSSRLPFFQPNLFYYSKDMLVDKEKDKFGLTGLGLAWKHHTMDSATASHLMVEMVQSIEHGFHEPQVSVWETFRLLRGEGYAPEDIYRLLKLKRDLKFALDELPSRVEFSLTVDATLAELETIVRKTTPISTGA